MTKKRELPPDRLAECQRLNNLFLSKKKALGLTVQAIADKAQITPVAVSHYLKGSNPLNMSFAADMAMLLHVPVNSFSPRLASDMARIARAVDSMESGAGLSQSPHSALANWAPVLSGAIERLMTGQNPAAISLHQCSDDSMEPSLSLGDVVVVDASVRSLAGEGLFAAEYAGSTYLRRFQRVINGGYLMLSDNTKYPAVFIDQRDSAAFVIRGKVIGALRSLRL